MTSKDQAYVAERVDKFQKTIAIGLLVLAAAWGVEIAQFWVEEGTREILEDVSFWMFMLVIVIILPSVLGVGYLKYKYRGACIEQEGFVLEAVKKASVMSFSLTFAFMVFINGFLVFNDDAELDFFPDMPVRFYLKSIMAFTLIIQSLFFFWYTRDSSGDDEFEGEAE
ncbi:MAG: hypothetical protein IH995_10550 [Proteobacteria bacterium]|nr:hypothetical protein [Pseudomonadota bacterium]